MTDRLPDGFDPVDPTERDFLRRVQAWTEQAVPTDDPAVVVRVTTTGLRRRQSTWITGGRGAWLAAVGLVTVMVVGGLALQNAPSQTAQASRGPDGSPAIGAVATLGGVSGMPGVVQSPAETSASTDVPTDTPTAVPTSQSTPAVVTPKPTEKPPKKSPRPDPGPTDSWHTDWTPPPGFQGTFKASFTCTEANGDHQVIYTAVFDSPVEVTTVEMFLDGDWFARGGPPVGDELVGEVIVGRYLPAGTTHSALARFFTGPYNVDFIALRETGTFTVPEGPLC